MLAFCINRNIMECKVHCVRALNFKIQVLIETLWNVKSDKFMSINVKRDSINRNIMECKEFFSTIF